MSRINLYQTVKDENGADYIEQNGPFVCNRNDAWLGSGAYFWEYDIELAHWWGKTAYKDKYVICQSAYESYAEDYFNLYGNSEHLDILYKVCKMLEKSLNDGNPKKKIKISVRKAIGFLKEKNIFPYKAIRINSNGDKNAKIPIREKYKEYFQLSNRVQICVIDKSFLKSDYAIVYPHEYVLNGGI